MACRRGPNSPNIQFVSDPMPTVHPSTDQQMTPEQTILAMFDHLDERRYDELLSLMTPQAVWHRQGKRLQGHAQILAALNERSATQRIRHLVTNLLQRSAGDDSASFSHYMTALRFDDGQAHDGPVTVRQPYRMSLVTTQLVRTGGVWRVAEQAIVTEFEFST